MILSVSGNIISNDSVTFSEIDFGKNKSSEKYPYEIISNMEFFLEKFEAIYTACIDELIRDDDIVRQNTSESLIEINYPSLDQFLHLSEAERMKLIETYFVFDILRIYLNEENYKPETKWIVETLSSFTCSDTQVFIKGDVSVLA